MMKDSEKIKMEINIGGENIEVTVPFHSQEAVRDVEMEIGELYTKWRRAFPTRSDKTILAMMVYQFASHYKDLTAKHRQAIEEIEDCIARIEGDIR